MLCSHKRARQMLDCGRARVHRLMPFVIRLIDRQVADSATQALCIKLDPGRKTTGLAFVRDVEVLDTQTGEVSRSACVLSLMEIVHRGRRISKALTARRQMRRRRRASLHFREPRLLNRGNKIQGSIAPSLQHRVDTTLSWVKRLQRWAAVAAISSELARFDMQKLQNPEISGVAFQRDTLFGFEVREYLLEKWGRTCAYCDIKDKPLQIEHIQPRALGDSERISNLCLACQTCNQAKAAKTLEAFLAKDPKRLAKIKAQAKVSLRDAAAVNTTRWALANALKAFGLSVELSSGARTKFNRTSLNVPKTHALDAACVGEIVAITNWQQPTLQVKCMGRGSYQRTRLNKYGFPRGYLMRNKQVNGFATGDMVKAVVPKGAKKGEYQGRVAVRACGSFNIQTKTEVVQGISHKHCQVLQRSDGFGYFLNPKIASQDVSLGRLAGVELSLPGMNAGVSRAIH